MPFESQFCNFPTILSVYVTKQTNQTYPVQSPINDCYWAYKFNILYRQCQLCCGRFSRNPSLSCGPSIPTKFFKIFYTGQVQFMPGGWGHFWEFLVGVCCLILQILTLLQTKKCHFSTFVSRPGL